MTTWRIIRISATCDPVVKIENTAFYTVYPILIFLLVSSSPHSMPVNAATKKILHWRLLWFYLPHHFKSLHSFLYFEQTNFRQFSQQLHFYCVRLSLSDKRNVKRAERMKNNVDNKKETPCPESASELYQPSDRRLSAKLMPTSADIG
jgi:hypothetical protein